MCREAVRVLKKKVGYAERPRRPVALYEIAGHAFRLRHVQCFGVRTLPARWLPISVPNVGGHWL
jgi:hypothetical protein